MRKKHAQVDFSSCVYVILVTDMLNVLVHAGRVSLF